ALRNRTADQRPYQRLIRRLWHTWRHVRNHKMHEKSIQFSVFLDVDGRWRTLSWRREWDSNPRYGFPYTRFPSVRLKPLGHPSDNANQYEKSERQYSVGVPRYNPARHALRRAAKSRVPGRWLPALRHSAAMKDRATPLDLSWW